MKFLIQIVCIFVIVGLFLPFIHEALEQPVSNYDLSTYDDQPDLADIITGNVFLSVLSMFFWTFGALPFFLDGFFVLLRIILVIIGIRVFRGVG